MNASPDRMSASRADIANLCLEIAGTDFLSAISLASGDARKGSLNPHTADKLAEDLKRLVLTAQSVAAALGGIRTDDLDEATYGPLASAKRHGIGLASALLRAQRFAATIAQDVGDTQLSRRDLRRNLDSARAHSANLTDDLDLVHALVLARASNVDGAEAAKRSDRSSRVAPTAARVLTVTVWPLPASSRARYAAEFRTELWELAQSGASRRAQVAYATRQLRSAWKLRAALRAPVRQRAGAS